MQPYRHRATLIAVGVAGLMAGVACVVANLPAGRGLIIVSCVGLALALGAQR